MAVRFGCAITRLGFVNDMIKQINGLIQLFHIENAEPRIMQRRQILIEIGSIFVKNSADGIGGSAIGHRM